MESETAATSLNSGRSVKDGLHISGTIHFESGETLPAGLNLIAAALDHFGNVLGFSEIDPGGKFEIAAKIDHRCDIDVVVGMRGDLKKLRQADAHWTRVSASMWKERPGGGFQVAAEPHIAQKLLKCWLPVHVVITGSVRKVMHHPWGTTSVPVPFVKLEFFDVDREPYLWPLLKAKLPILAGKKVFRLDEPPTPVADLPGPLPTPEELAQIVMLNPQPEPPIYSDIARRFAAVAPRAAYKRVGDMAEIADTEALQVESLTLNSLYAPWQRFPNFFYSKRLIATVYDDFAGNYRCEFDWFPLHVRHGRLHLDKLPDIIVRLTQVVDGVERVLYLDPYSSTRWNVSNAVINFYLDDPSIYTGSGNDQERPVGTMAFFTGIGNDDAFQINQATGLFHNSDLSNMAYGHIVHVRAQFGDTLSWRLAIPGANPPYYYRLSYSADHVNFFPITQPLTDTRVHKFTGITQSVVLGPVVVGGEHALYEMRYFGPYLWYNPDDIGIWDTRSLAPGIYTLRLEVFDAAGTKLTSAFVDYRNGASTASPLPEMTDCCDLTMAIDNTPVTLSISVPDASGECGVVVTSAASPLTELDIDISASQPRNHVYGCWLYYTKGMFGSQIYLDSATFAAGTGAFNDTVDAVAKHMFDGVTTTCGFAVWLGAWAHIRNGYGFVYYSQLFKPIVLDKN